MAIVEVLPNKVGNINDVELAIRGYNIYTNDNPKRGCIIYVKDSNISTSNSLGSCEFDESVWCNIMLERGDKLCVGCVYRSPNSTNINNIALNKLIEQANRQHPYHILILVDFNYENIDWETLVTVPGATQETAQFVETVNFENLYQHVKQYTRSRSDQNPSILDLILTNETNMVDSLRSLNPLGKSDHTVLLFDYVCYGVNSHNLEKYNYFSGNYDMIRKELSNTWSLLPGTNESVNEVWARLENKLIGLIEKYIPKAMIRKGNHQSPLG